MKFINLLIFLILSYACSSTSRVKINSFPEKADVVLITNDSESKPLGTTPLELNGRDVYSANSRMSMLQVSKEGYETNHIFIAQDTEEENYNISVKLKSKAENLKSQDSNLRQEKLAQGIARANNFINLKKFAEAEKVLFGLTQEFSQISVIYDLLGNVAYLQRNFKSALTYYQKSKQLNPENIETRNIIEKLKGMTN